MGSAPKTPQFGVSPQTSPDWSWPQSSPDVGPTWKPPDLGSTPKDPPIWGVSPRRPSTGVGPKAPPVGTHVEDPRFGVRPQRPPPIFWGQPRGFPSAPLDVATLQCLFEPKGLREPKNLREKRLRGPKFGAKKGGFGAKERLFPSAVPLLCCFGVYEWGFEAKKWEFGA